MSKMTKSELGTYRTKTSLGWADVTPFETTQELFACRDRVTYKGSWGKESKQWRRHRRAVLEGDVDDALASQVERQVAEMAALMTIGDTYEMAPAGSYPIVPAAVAGDPFSMRRRVQSHSASAPVKIWFPVTTSCGLSKKDYAAMISMAAALVITLAEVRPIELVSYSTLQCYDDNLKGHNEKESVAGIITCPIETSSMDARSIAAWCDVYLGRTIQMSIHGEISQGWRGGWGFGRYPSSYADPVVAATREAVGAGDDDVMIPCGISSHTVTDFRKMAVKLAESSGATLTLESHK